MDYISIKLLFKNGVYGELHQSRHGEWRFGSKELLRHGLAIPHIFSLSQPIVFF